MQEVWLRLDRTVIARVDRVGDGSAKRAEVLRYLIQLGLTAYENELDLREPKRPAKSPKRAATKKKRG